MAATAAAACSRWSAAASRPPARCWLGRSPGLSRAARQQPGLDGLDLQGHVPGVDAALREAAGHEPEPGLRRALEHVAQLLVGAESPHRADTLGDRVAEQLAHQRLLAFP